MIHGNKELRQRNPEPRSRRTLRLAYLLLVAIMAVFAFQFIHKVQEIRQLKAEEMALRSGNTAIAQQNEELRQSIQYFQTPQYVEDSARSYFGYTMPGEVVLRVQPVHHSGIPQMRAAPPGSVSPPPPVWQQWVNAFSNS